MRSFRLLWIFWVLMRFGLYELAFSLPVLRYCRFLEPLLRPIWLRHAHKPRGERLRLALECLGPTFVKLGQALSTRRDLIPLDIANELAKLQDQVPAFSSEVAKAIVIKSLGQPLDEIFIQFDDKPLAAASIAQVHTAILKSGQSVVVKIVRPQIERVIRRDIALLQILAGLAERYWRDGKRLRPFEVVAEYERAILSELDLSLEAANGTRLRRNFEDSDQLYVPEINWQYTRREVMVMERINGIPIGQGDLLDAAGVNRKVLAERGVEIFFTQVFKHSFFHADMHPGNIFVDASNPELPRYIALDFGIIGTLNSNDQRYLADNFLAFFNRDYHRVAELHIESGWVPAHTSVDDFEAAIRSLCEPIFDKPLKDISFGGFLLSLFQTARRFQMEVQPQLILLQKTLLAIEGLGRQLYPELDLWQTAKPFLTQFMQQQRGPKAQFERVRSHLPQWAILAPDMPLLTHRALKRIADGEQLTRIDARDLNSLQKVIVEQTRRIVYGLIGAILFGFAWSGLYYPIDWITMISAIGSLWFLRLALRQ